MKVLIFLTIILAIHGKTTPWPSTTPPSSESGSSISSVNLVDIVDNNGELKTNVDLPSNQIDKFMQKIQDMFSRSKLIDYSKTKEDKWNLKLKKDDFPELTDPMWILNIDMPFTDEMEPTFDSQRRHKIHHNYENINVYGLNDLKEANLKVYTLRNEAILDMYFEQLVINGSYVETSFEILSRDEENLYRYNSMQQPMTQRPTSQPPVNFEIKLYKFVKYRETINYSYTPMVQPENILNMSFEEHAKIEYGELDTKNLSHNLAYYNQTIIPKVSLKIQRAVRNAIFKEIRRIIKKNEMMRNKLEDMIHDDMVLIRDHYVQGEELLKIENKDDNLDVTEL